MKVVAPTGYDVELTVEEIKIMSKCKEILQGIADTLEEKDAILLWIQILL